MGRSLALYYTYLYTYIFILYYTILHEYIVYKPFLECVSRIRPCKRQLEGLDPNRASDFTRDERSLPYLTLPVCPIAPLFVAPSSGCPLAMATSLSLSLLGSFHCQPRWVTRVTFLFFLVFLRIAPSTFSYCRRRPVKPCSPYAVPRPRSLDRLLAQHLINPNLFQPQLQPQL